MAITTDRATSFLAECMQGIHLTTDVYKLALIKVGHAGTYSHATTNVGTPGTGTPTTANLGTDEASGTGYTSGGITLGAPSITVNGRVVRFDFPDPAALAGATLSAVGCVVYNSTKANRVVCVCDFGGTITSTGSAFDIGVPAVGDATSLVRVS